MEYLIKNKSGEELAKITFDSVHKPIFLGTPEKEFEKFLNESVAKGIDWIHDIYSADDKSSNLIVDTARPTDSIYPLILKEFLERNGYNVTEQNPEVAEKIKTLLTKFPNDNKDKIDIIERLPKMSHLEQTIILEGLEKII